MFLSSTVALLRYSASNIGVTLKSGLGRRFSLSFLFGVANAPFACQRWGLPHRLAQCTTPGKHNKIIYFISRWRKVFSTVLLSHRCILKVERSKVKVKELAKSFCCNSAAVWLTSGQDQNVPWRYLCRPTTKCHDPISVSKECTQCPHFEALYYFSYIAMRTGSLCACALGTSIHYTLARTLFTVYMGASEQLHRVAC